MNNINFNQIYSSFIEFFPCIKISYLMPQEMRKVLNFPNKENHSTFSGDDIDVIEKNHGIFLIIMQNGDLSKLQKQYQSNLNQLIDKKLKFLQYQELFYINKKMALMMGGLGQYSKNQLVYNNDYGFLHMTRIFAIYNSITNLPIRQLPAYGYTEMCINCNECIKNCPAHAIHNDLNFAWVDYDRCRNYCFFGESNKFYSVKYGINEFLNNQFTKKQLLSIKNNKDFKQLFGFNCEDSFVPNLEGGKSLLIFDYCRECINQLPCRKQEYIYNKNSYQLSPDDNMLEI